MRARYFGELHKKSTVDAFDAYIQSPTIDVADPLQYWASLDPAKNPLAQMAVDYLSAPGTSLRNIFFCFTDLNSTATSTHTERSFSSGSATISRFRHSLSDKSVRASTVLGSHASQGFVPVDEVIAMFRAKGKRWRVDENSDGKGKGKEVVEVLDDVSDSGAVSS